MVEVSAERTRRSIRTTTRKAERRESSKIPTRRTPRPATENTKKIKTYRTLRPPTDSGQQDAASAQRSEGTGLGSVIVPAAPAKPLRGMKLKTVSGITMLFALLCLGAFLAGRPPISAARVDARPQSKEARHVSRAKNGRVSSAGSRKGHKVVQRHAGLEAMR
jgi:hypothetical protein